MGALSPIFAKLDPFKIHTIYFTRIDIDLSWQSWSERTKLNEESPRFK